MYKIKHFDDGLWYVLASNAQQTWAKISEMGYQTAEEAEQALCRQLDADTPTRHEGLYSGVGSQS